MQRAERALGFASSWYNLLENWIWGRRENQIRDRKVIRMLSKGLSKESQMKTDFAAVGVAERSQLLRNQNQEMRRYWKAQIPRGCPCFLSWRPGVHAGEMSTLSFHVVLPLGSNLAVCYPKAGPQAGCGRCLWWTGVMALPAAHPQSSPMDHEARHSTFRFTVPCFMFGIPCLWKCLLLGKGQRWLGLLISNGPHVPVTLLFAATHMCRSTENAL